MKRYKFNNIAVAAIALLPAMIFSSCKKSSVVQPSPTAITTTGVVTTVAGSGASGASNSTSSSASFNYPQGIAADAAGNLYVADQGNNEIREISTTGAVTTLAGTLASGSTNATKIGVAASFNGPTGVAVDAAGATVYVADFGNNLIRKIVVATGAVTTLAGGKSGKADGTGTAASFNGPAGLAVDAAGNVYVADFNNNLIRVITPDGVVTTLAGSTAGNTNGTGTAASFNGPRGVAVDATGNVFVADANNNLIREITPTGVVTTFAGTGKPGNTSGIASSSTFNYPSGVTVDVLTGDVYVADAVNNLVRKISGGTVTSIAGSGYVSLTTPFSAPSGVAFFGGSVYVANDYGNLIQKVAQQ